MIAVKELLARKQLLLKRLHEDDLGPHEPDQIERLPAQIDTALNLIEEDFDSQTLANMNVALDRVCQRRPDGEDHELRKFVAEQIIRCAKMGRRTLGAFTEAGERALARWHENNKKSA